MDPRLKKLQDEIRDAIAGAPSDRWGLSPSGKWCAAEVLEHLYLTYTGTSKGFERVAGAGKPLVTPATWKQRGSALVVLGWGYMPSGREAPKMARPRGLPPEMVRKLGRKLPKWIREFGKSRMSSERKRNCSIIRFWGRSRAPSGGSSTLCMGAITCVRFDCSRR